MVVAFDNTTYTLYCVHRLYVRVIALPHCLRNRNGGCDQLSLLIIAGLVTLIMVAHLRTVVIV